MARGPRSASEKSSDDHKPKHQSWPYYVSDVSAAQAVYSMA